MIPPRRIPWLALALGLGVPLTGVVAHAILAYGIELPPCPSKILLGLPCVTCGGTRCVMAIVQGKLDLAFHWHPVLLSLVVLSPLAVAWDVHRAIKGTPYPSLPQGLGWRVAAVLAFLGTWALQVARGI